MLKSNKTDEESVKAEGGIDYSQMYAMTMKTLKPGEITKGKIIHISSKEMVIDIGFKSEGIIPLNEFPEKDTLKIGDEIDVLIEKLEDDNGMVVISRNKAEKIMGWEKIMNNYKEGDIISGRATRKVKGGLMVNVGIEAFLPASQSTLKPPIDLNSLIGKDLDYKIVKINKARRNIIVSRKEVLQVEVEQRRCELLDKLQRGELVKGKVKNITDFGAFISLGGIDGLLHITDMSWGRISHPSEVLAVGDEVEVVVLDFNKDSMKISLGLKQKQANPWEDIDRKYPIGSKVKGKIVNIVPYGAFIELEKGIEGLVHISELSWTKRINHPTEVLAIGDMVEAIVLSMDKQQQKISLGIKQIEPNPWLEVITKYPTGSKVKGKVKNLTDYGAFIELDDNIDGLIHISDMSWTKKMNHPSEVLKKGEKIEAVVLSVDQENMKLALGLKQLREDPWPELIKEYSIGRELEGAITKITNFGLFVEIAKDLEGLVHISEMPEDVKPPLEDRFKVGDKVSVRVIKVDGEQRKIGLSLK
ncbi:MAG: 30S ribosomal protein S1 [Candidatus Omnitrophica bacterium]|nr:30S ribosomal protein S1 [Candidatus Omnitrophota bacterium]